MYEQWAALFVLRDGFFALGILAIPARALPILVHWSKQEIEATKKKAEAGDAEAQSLLGYMYMHGDAEPIRKFVPRDPKKKYPPVTNDPFAPKQHPYWDIVPDYPKAVIWLKKSANNGDVWGEYYLAQLYESGNGVKKNLVTAAHWYSQAAEKGHRPSQYQLGLLYQQGGNGLEKDYKFAAKWFLEAVKQNDKGAARELGMIYFHGGPDFPRNFKEAYFWLSIWNRRDKFLDKVSVNLNNEQLEALNKRIEKWKPEKYAVDYDPRTVFVPQPALPAR